jgi:2-isopropylmalate synthase
VRFVLDRISETGKDISVTWHGHNDRGLALVNSLAAAEEGAGVISGAFLGIGERSGNTALEQVIMYLYQHGASHFRVNGVPAYCKRLAECVDLPISKNAPLVGEQAFATCTGTHASAILKARTLGADFEDLVFSCVPASKLGRRQELMIGPLSGLANAKYMLDLISVESTLDNASKLLNEAKRHNRWLETEEIRSLFLDTQTKDADG